MATLMWGSHLRRELLSLEDRSFSIYSIPSLGVIFDGLSIAGNLERLLGA